MPPEKQEEEEGRRQLHMLTLETSHFFVPVVVKTLGVWPRDWLLHLHCCPSYRGHHIGAPFPSLPQAKGYGGSTAGQCSCRSGLHRCCLLGSRPLLEGVLFYLCMWCCIVVNICCYFTVLYFVCTLYTYCRHNSVL